MTDRKRPKGSVLDPSWEDTLRSGQEAEGEKGSVEPELAVIHLLRHAREPEGLADDRLDAVWGDMQPTVAPAPWWKKPWMIWAPVAAAAAVTLFVIVKPPEEAPEVAVATESARADDRAEAAPPAAAPASEGEAAPGDGAASEMARSGNAALLEKQFALLEPGARAEIDTNVESQRGSLRYGLIDAAKGGGQ